MLLTNATLATMTNGTSLMEGAAILIEDDHIAWVGPMADAPACADSRDLGGRLVTPGLIDCHTHLVHGGNRAREFEMRLNGASYEAVARAGGGIISTVRATREASEADLLASALLRLDRMLAEGVTTVEVKSGYGLTVADELKMLRVARGLTKARPVTVHVSFLAAHASPATPHGLWPFKFFTACVSPRFRMPWPWPRPLPILRTNTTPCPRTPTAKPLTRTVLPGTWCMASGSTGMNWTLS